MEDHKESDLLDEYIPLPPYKSRMYLPLLVLCITVSVFINYTIYRQSRIYYFEWISLLLSLVVPGTGVMLCFMKTRAGWFIATMYYSLVGIFVITAVISSFTTNRFIPSDTFTRLKQGALVALLLSVIILSWSNTIRKHYAIKPLLAIITLMLTILIICIVVMTG